jgi:SAM-dependent methyltransferase
MAPSATTRGNSQQNYTQSFFDCVGPGSLQSARIVLPILFDLIQPKSVIDVGCGTGTWLKSCLENGITDILGLDGDYIDRDTLLIDPSQFTPIDLTKLTSPPRRFDLAICLEVAEHLPPRCSKNLIRYLTEAAPYVLFSAALPGQGGVNHINEQWPQFWRDLFQDRGFLRLDPIRPKIWLNTDVQQWYRQNIYLFVRAEDVSETSFLRDEYEKARIRDLELVNPNIIERYSSVRGLLKALPDAIIRAIRRRLYL